jgi:hypothetical protein
MSPATDRAAINRANAQLVVMPTEDLEANKRHVASFVVEYDPQGATESNLVQALADASWRLKRVAALETNLLTFAGGFESQSKALANLSMHTQRLSRQFERTVAQLRGLQKTRLDIMEMRKKKGEIYIQAQEFQQSRRINVGQADSLRPIGNRPLPLEETGRELRQRPRTLPAFQFR